MDTGIQKWTVKQVFSMEINLDCFERGVQKHGGRTAERKRGTYCQRLTRLALPALRKTTETMKVPHRENLTHWKLPLACASFQLQFAVFCLSSLSSVWARGPSGLDMGDPPWLRNFGDSSRSIYGSEEMISKKKVNDIIWAAVWSEAMR